MPSSSATPAAPRSILVLFAHPAFRRSRVQSQLVEEIYSMRDLTFHDLYEEYPDLVIDVEREQRQLVEHDVIVFQHPLYWWSTPAILKEWQDLVLEHGWAYGTGAEALRGKLFLHVLSAGGSEETYRQDDSSPTLADYLLPLHDTARLCGMRVLPPFAVLGTHNIAEIDLQVHSRRYRRLLEALRDRSLDLARVADWDVIDARLDDVLGDDS